MNNLCDLVADYYPAIDRSDVEHILRLFAEDAVYERAGVEYRHLPSIRKFFSEDRNIRGKHVINGLWSDEASRTVFVTGRFEGQGAAGDARSFGFADVWHFNVASMVTKRESFLALGHAHAAR
jgi:ketosteroid isomerase-like protein